MRNVINISLPENSVKFVESEVKKGKFATKSEFFRVLVRKWEEDFLLKELKEAQKDFEAGKFKKLRSLKDLM